MTGIHIGYLSCGSNLGDRKANLRSAIADLCAGAITVRRISSAYETEPVGFRDQPWFMNIALEVETGLTPRELLAGCQKIEEAHGRIRSFTGAPRQLDLDILLFDNLIIDEPSLQIPHPKMAARRFVLEPLAQIAPGVCHPVQGKSIRFLLAACPDTSKVILHSELAE
jgi:2-amino-4-hydroxy-6-hydroxymethyldihydropteridine diphosphokinase